jgi:hypothetical protein
MQVKSPHCLDEIVLHENKRENGLTKKGFSKR